MSTTSSEVKIPNVYRRLHPTDIAQAVNKEDFRPAGVELNTTIKYILRDGRQGQCLAGRMWWGDGPHETGAIVAYKKIKLEKAWIEWGYRYDRGEELEIGYGGMPLALTGENPIVKIWLRDYSTPQEDTRRAHSWDWSISGESSSDIMKYRIVGR